MPEPVFLFAGQSNTVGQEFVATAPGYLDTTHTNIKIYETRNVNLTDDFGWNSLDVGTNNIAPGSGSGQWGYISEFMYRIQQAIGGTVRMIKYAKNGTPLNTDASDDWNPVNDELYSIWMDNYVLPGLAALDTAEVDYLVRAIIWLQGERDSKFETYANNYDTNMAAFITQARIDLGLPDLPFVIIRIADDLPIGSYAYKETVRTAQLQTGNGTVEIDNVYWFDSDSFDMKPDDVHFDAQGYLDIGLKLSEFFENISGVAMSATEAAALGSQTIASYLKYTATDLEIVSDFHRIPDFVFSDLNAKAHFRTNGFFKL